MIQYPVSLKLMAMEYSLSMDCKRCIKTSHSCRWFLLSWYH